jgi:hypothetical protein
MPNHEFFVMGVSLLVFQRFPLVIVFVAVLA